MFSVFCKYLIDSGGGPGVLGSSMQEDQTIKGLLMFASFLCLVSGLSGSFTEANVGLW